MVHPRHPAPVLTGPPGPPNPSTAAAWYDANAKWLAVAFLDAVGTTRVPKGLWRAMRRFASWIKPALVTEWARLIKLYAAVWALPRDEAAATEKRSDPGKGGPILPDRDRDAGGWTDVALHLDGAVSVRWGAGRLTLRKRSPAKRSLAPPAC